MSKRNISTPAAERELAAAGADLERLRKHDRRAFVAVKRTLRLLVANARQQARAA